MKKKIFLNSLILIIIGITITGFFTSELAQKFYKREVEEKLKNTARLIEYQVSTNISKASPIDYNQLARDYAKLLDEKSKNDTSFESDQMKTRITFVDNKGKVLGESDTNYQSMENHLHRKEIQEALLGKVGEDIRFSKTLKINYLYIAVRLESSDVIVRVAVPLMQLKKIDEIIWIYTIIGILAGFLLTTLLALRFSTSVTRPINELIAFSKEISQGNYTKQVIVNSQDEIGELAETFNEMALRLEKTIADMVDKNIKVDSIINSMINGVVAVDREYRIILINSVACDMFSIKNGPGLIGINMIELIKSHQINSLIQETVEKNVPLINEIIIGPPEDKIYRVFTTPIKSKDYSEFNSGGIATIHDITNIKKLEQIRTEFVSNVTHELKTPLTSIKGFIETLRGGAIHDENVASKFLEIIDIEAERLYTLINDILQLSEIESKQKDTDITTFQIEHLLKEVLSVLQGMADKKNITLAYEIENNISMTASRNRIKQMLINLIDNGIKYNVKNGKVLVAVYKNNGKVIIAVRDTGIGISEEHIPRIFERFYRVDKGRSRNMGGTGLGLSIVKHIINLYNGDININSKPGIGTEFIIQLPL